MSVTVLVVRPLSVALLHDPLRRGCWGNMCDRPGNLALCAAVCMSLMVVIDLCSLTGVNLSANGASLDGGDIACSP